MNRDQRLARQIVARGVAAWEQDDFEAAPETFLGVLEDFPHFADVRNKAGLCEAVLQFAKLGRVGVDEQHKCGVL